MRILQHDIFQISSNIFSILFFSVVALRTRDFVKRVQRLGILLPKLKVERSQGLERFMILNMPVRNPAVNYRRSGPAVKLKKVNVVPIGARGRKRNTINILYIGSAPNVDDCTKTKPASKKQASKKQASVGSKASSVQIPSVQIPSVQTPTATPRPIASAPISYARSTVQTPTVSNIPMPTQASYASVLKTPQPQPVKPAKRTYTRLASTPFPVGKMAQRRMRAISTPLPDKTDDNDSTINNDSTIDKDSTIEISFDTTFGHLNYSDSE